MTALTRMRTLAAACALLFVFAGTTAAGPVDRFIDRTGIPEEPQRPMVGDPDTGHDSPAFIVIWGQVIMFRLPWISMSFGQAGPHLRLTRGWR